MSITVINTEQEYLDACKQMDEFLDCHAEELNQLPPEADKEFRLLSLVIADYENKHYPIPHADPIEFIRFMMEQKNRNPSPIDIRWLNVSTQVTPCIQTDVSRRGSFAVRRSNPRDSAPRR